MIRKIYKNDYRGYDIEITRRNSEETKSLKYSNQKNRNRIRELLMEDFHSKCAYCGWKYNGFGNAQFHIDHLKPQSINGQLIDEYSNLVLTCDICNTTKKDNQLNVDMDTISSELKKKLYRNSFGAIVVNNNCSNEESLKYKKFIKAVGLDKEVHKLDYIIMALDIIQKDCLKEEKVISSVLNTLNELREMVVRKTDYIRY